MEALLRQHQEQIYRFGMRLCGNPDDAKDVLQDTLIAVARSLPDFRGGSSLSTWLFTIARSFCIKKRRKSKFAPAHEVSLEAGDGSAAIASTKRPPDEVVEQHEIGAAIEAAIDQLDPDQREVLLLRDVEGLKASEVADVLDLSVAAVKSRLHRARLQLRTALTATLEMDEPQRGGANCPDVLVMYSKHLEGDIDSELCAEMERHLADCKRCRGVCDSLKYTLSLCRSAPTVSVPRAVQDSVRDALREFLAASSSHRRS